MTIKAKMIPVFFKALGQINDPSIKKIILTGMGLALAVFLLLLTAVFFLLLKTTLFAMPWLESAADFLEWLAALIIAWMLFPGAASAVSCLFLDRVAAAVESRHYKSLPKAGGVQASGAMLAAAKLLALNIAANMALLPLLVTPFFPFVFYAVNGYLLGCEYFEMIAQRRISAGDAAVLRRKHRWRLFFFGVMIAFMLTLPVINLLAPVIAAAMMVHFFEDWRRAPN